MLPGSAAGQFSMRPIMGGRRRTYPSGIDFCLHRLELMVSGAWGRLEGEFVLCIVRPIAMEQARA